MRLFIIIIFVVIGMLLACQDNPTATLESETFVGQLVVTKWQQAYQWTFVDTDLVLLTVTGGQYELVHIESNTNLCNSRGTVSNFGSNRMTLTPSSKDGTGSCDTLRVPQGEFVSVFRGDSLFIGPTEVTINTVVNGKPSFDIMTYKFELRQ